MPVGFQTYDDSGKTLIDSELIGMGLIKSGVLSTRSTITLPATNPIVFMSGFGCRLWRAWRPSAGNWSLDIQAANYYIFDNMRSVPGSGSRPRIEVYRDDGTVTYTSEMYPMSPVYSQQIGTAVGYPPTDTDPTNHMPVSVSGGPFAGNLNMSRNGVRKANSDPFGGNDFCDFTYETFSTTGTGYRMEFDNWTDSGDNSFFGYGNWPRNTTRPIMTLINTTGLPTTYSIVG